MASRPLYNGAARACTDNNLGGALLNEFCIRAQVGAALGTGSDAIANTTFEAKAGGALTIHYDVRKFGAGLEADTPTEGRVFVFLADDLNDAVAGAALDSGDVVAGNALPRVGSFTFTPSQSGTYRLACWMRRVGTPSTKDWAAHSDGAASFGALADQKRAIFQDKGRLRYGHDLNSVTVTERGAAAPAKFAVTMNAVETALQESVRIESVQSHSQNKIVAGVHTYQFKQRRNGGATIDVNVETTIQNATTHRTEVVVDRLSFPNEGVNQGYDVVVAVEELSLLHLNNTPQYSGLGGQAADGAWVYFTAAGAGLTLTDYKTVTKLASHNVDAGGSIENVGAYSAALYAEDANGIPTIAEKFSFIFTDDNMTVKMGRVLNSRAEPLAGIFVVGQCVHEASGQNLITWGNNDAGFKTRPNGWQLASRTIQVTTPPAGIYKLIANAIFPGTAFGTPAARTFAAERIESGSPAAVGSGKDWIAPASFSTAWHAIPDPAQGGQAHVVTLTVFDKAANGDIVYRNADVIPVIGVWKRNRTTYAMEAHSAPAATAIATGQYIFTIVPDVVELGARDIYQIAADVTVGSFKRRWVEDVTVYAFNHASHNHDGQASSKTKTFFDPTGLFK